MLGIFFSSRLSCRYIRLFSLFLSILTLNTQVTVIIVIPYCNYIKHMVFKLHTLIQVSSSSVKSTMPSNKMFDWVKVNSHNQKTSLSTNFVKLYFKVKVCLCIFTITFITYTWEVSSVIIYSSSCCSKPVLFSIFCRIQKQTLQECPYSFVHIVKVNEVL